jgi:hypothetical protein
MRYKFLKPFNLQTGLLNSFKGNFEEMFIPNENTDEKYCYVVLMDSDLTHFKKHFGELIVSGEDEYPSSYDSTINGKLHKFMLLKPRE